METRVSHHDLDVVKNENHDLQNSLSSAFLATWCLQAHISPARVMCCGVGCCGSWRRLYAYVWMHIKTLVSHIFTLSCRSAAHMHASPTPKQPGQSRFLQLDPDT